MKTRGTVRGVSGLSAADRTWVKGWRQREQPPGTLDARHRAHILE
jgi:hypothetical protein